MSLRLRLLTPIVTAVVSAIFQPATAQGPVPDPADVGTIEGIIRAWYDVINGSAGAPRQWRRDSTLYRPGATFVSLEERNDKQVAVTYTPEEFRRANNASLVKDGMFETQIGSRVERFGNLAQVRSVYESRRSAKGPIFERGVNYILLYWDGKRWWITGASWQTEDASTRLPQAWLGRDEKMP